MFQANLVFANVSLEYTLFVKIVISYVSENFIGIITVHHYWNLQIIYPMLPCFVLLLEINILNLNVRSHWVEVWKTSFPWKTTSPYGFPTCFNKEWSSVGFYIKQLDVELIPFVWRVFLKLEKMSLIGWKIARLGIQERFRRELHKTVVLCNQPPAT